MPPPADNPLLSGASSASLGLTKLELPVDLNELFTYSFSVGFDNLRVALEFLTKNMNMQNMRVAEIEKQMAEKKPSNINPAAVDSLVSRCDKLEEENRALKEELSALSQQQLESSQKIDSIAENMDKNTTMTEEALAASRFLQDQMTGLAADQQRAVAQAEDAATKATAIEEELDKFRPFLDDIVSVTERVKHIEEDLRASLHVPTTPGGGISTIDILGIKKEVRARASQEELDRNTKLLRELEAKLALLPSFDSLSVLRDDVRRVTDRCDETDEKIEELSDKISGNSQQLALNQDLLLHLQDNVAQKIDASSTPLVADQGSSSPRAGEGGARTPLPLYVSQMSSSQAPPALLGSVQTAKIKELERRVKEVEEQMAKKNASTSILENVISASAAQAAGLASGPDQRAPLVRSNSKLTGSNAKGRPTSQAQVLADVSKDIGAEIQLRLRAFEKEIDGVKFAVNQLSSIKDGENAAAVASSSSAVGNNPSTASATSSSSPSPRPELVKVKTGADLGRSSSIDQATYQTYNARINRLEQLLDAAAQKQDLSTLEEIVITLQERLARKADRGDIESLRFMTRQGTSSPIAVPASVSVPVPAAVADDDPAYTAYKLQELSAGIQAIQEALSSYVSHSELDEMMRNIRSMTMHQQRRRGGDDNGSFGGASSGGGSSRNLLNSPRDQNRVSAMEARVVAVEANLDKFRQVISASLESTARDVDDIRNASLPQLRRELADKSDLDRTRTLEVMITRIRERMNEIMTDLITSTQATTANGDGQAASPGGANAGNAGNAADMHVVKGMLYKLEDKIDSVKRSCDDNERAIRTQSQPGAAATGGAAASGAQASSGSLTVINSAITRLETTVRGLQQQVDDVQALFNGQLSSRAGDDGKASPDGVRVRMSQFSPDSDGQLSESLRALVAQVRDELVMMIQKLQSQVLDRATVDMLTALAEQLQTKADQAVVAKKADRNEIRRAIRALEKQVSMISSPSGRLSPVGGNNMELDGEAILARKPLEGWKCGSCDRPLDKMWGAPAEFNPWNKLPQAPDKNFKYGPGFSRILSSMKTLPSPERSRMESAFSSQHQYLESSVASLPPGSAPTVNVSSPQEQYRENYSTPAGIQASYAAGHYRDSLPPTVNSSPREKGVSLPPAVKRPATSEVTYRAHASSGHA
eukprot:GILK01005122.1.p1 GENE.GILK01005122.1~~GILK01005122.1.p1  ORF type:complete len:1166 (-),score=248.25 GILK01005122.1:222-3719(-)